MENVELVILSFLFVAIPIFPPLIKWLWLHPYVNKRKMENNLTEAYKLKETLNAVEELIIDTKLQTMEKYNIRAKGITISWTDSINGREKSLTFMMDGKSKSTKALKELAKAIEHETDKRMMKYVFSLPKPHTKGDKAEAICIHGIGED